MSSSSASRRCALIGFGQVAEKAHLPAFAENGVQVVAFCEANEQRQTAARKALPEARPFLSVDDMLDAELELDFVDIATPPFLHAAQALAALKRGRHVLCEKPLALAREDLAALRRSAMMAGRAVFTVHNWAYSPQWIKILELAPLLGELRHAELHVVRTQPAAGANTDDWRRQAAQAGGGILVDHGWHGLYLLHRLIGAQPERMVARLRPQTGAIDEEASVFFEFPRATALLHLSWRSEIRRNTALVVGAKGILELQDDEIFIRTSAGVRRFPFEKPLSAGSSHPSWFSTMLPDFFAEMTDAAKRGRNLEEASFCVSMISRAYQAARLGRNPLRATLSPHARASP